MINRFHALRLKSGPSVNSPASGVRRSSGRMVSSATLALGLIIGSVVSIGSPSWAGTSGRTKMADSSAYCKLLVSYTKKQAAADKALTTGSAEAQMKAAAAQLQGIEGLVLHVAPSQLQQPYKTVFNALNVLYGALAKVNYKYSKLSKSVIASFTKFQKVMTSASVTISTYNRKVCGVKS